MGAVADGPRVVLVSDWRLPELQARERARHAKGEVVTLKRDKRCSMCGNFILQGQVAVCVAEGSDGRAADYAHHEPPCRETITYGRDWARAEYPWHYITSVGEEADGAIVYFNTACGGKVRSVRVGGQVRDLRSEPYPLCDGCRQAGPPKRRLP